MFNNSLDSKEFFLRPDGEKIRDLTQTMFKDGEKNYMSYSLYKVAKDYAMRPDLISKSVYNNSLYAEIILKYNGISNPFSIAPDDVILIPDLDSALAIVKKIGSGSDSTAADRIRNSYKYIDPLKKPSRDDVLEEYSKRQIIDAPDGALPPNLAKEGESQISYQKGRAYFSQQEETCITSGLSTGEFLTKVIQNRK